MATKSKGPAGKARNSAARSKAAIVRSGRKNWGDGDYEKHYGAKVAPKAYADIGGGPGKRPAKPAANKPTGLKRRRAK